MILCLGTTPAVQRVMVFPRLRINAVNRAVDLYEAPAGKSVNVARVLAKMGHRPCVTGFLGGRRGEFIRRELDRAGVEHDFISILPETRLCITILDQDAGSHTELVEESRGVGPDAWDELIARLELLLPRASILVLSGSLPPEASVDFYHDCIRLAAARGIPSILDCHGTPLTRALVARPSLVKPNLAELAATVNISLKTSDDILQAMRRLMREGAATVVVTMGPDGAMAADAGRAWRISAPSIKAINPIGSGDAFTAGLALALLEARPLPEACRLAAACGAANALTLLAGDLRPQAVEELMQQIRITEL